ncbi:hypothetical protein BH11ACT6_BH11ACT6_01760 [soil metagenome]
MYDDEPSARVQPVHRDKASRRTAEEREEVFQRILDNPDPYGKVRPWFADVDERRNLYQRRYTRPEPPEGLTLDLAVIRGGAA